MGRLKQWRSVATRYERRPVNNRAVVVIAGDVAVFVNREIQPSYQAGKLR